MPGSNSKALDNGRKLPADGIILDLEDSVAPKMKQTARSQVAAAIAKGGFGGREVVVRINGFDTPWAADDIAAATRADAILLSKIDGPDPILKADALLSAVRSQAAIWCMMETPRAILRAGEIAACSPRLHGFAMGTSDLAKDLHCAHTPDRQPMMTALGLCILAARAEGLVILDGVYTNLTDEAGYEASCRQGADLGFDGKTVIHPKQIAPANRVYAPSDDAIIWSRRIIAAFAEAERDGKGVVLVDGELVEKLHVEDACRLIALAEAAEALEAAAAQD
jgi:citrate lyase subunit beta/citryl-CoA lyase